MDCYAARKLWEGAEEGWGEVVNVALRPSFENAWEWSRRKERGFLEEPAAALMGAISEGVEVDGLDALGSWVSRGTPTEGSIHL